MPSSLEYAVPGPLTTLAGIDPGALEGIGNDPAEICRRVASLVIQPNDARALGLPEDRFVTNRIRPAAELARHLLTLDAAPVTAPRTPELRIVGTCRHFAVLSCALLRQQGLPSRVRCGFATYFQPEQGLDHWITEYWDVHQSRWVRVDPEILALNLVPDPADLRPTEFLTGGEAWTAFRRGEIDDSRFGVHGTENWGAAEIRGNAVKDLAALNKTEMLPWDEWGRMTEAYEGRTGPDYDELLDTVAAICHADDDTAIVSIYQRRGLHVPAQLIG